MAVNKRVATPKPPQPKKIAPKKAEAKKTPIAKATEPKKTPIGKKKGPVAGYSEEQKKREMQEWSMRMHEEKQRKKLLAKDQKSKVSKPAEKNEDVEMGGSEVQATDRGEAQLANRVEIHVTEEDEMQTEGGEIQVTKEKKQVSEVGEVQDESQAGDHHEEVAQANVPQGNGIVTSEGGVREGVSVDKLEVPTAQMFGAVGNVEMTAPFAANIKKVQTGSAPPTAKTPKRKVQEDIEKMRAEEGFMEFSKTLQQEDTGPNNKNQHPENISTLNTEISYMPNTLAFLSALQDQRSPSARPHLQQFLMGLSGRGPAAQQIAQLRGGAGGSVDPLFQYKPTQLPPTTQAPSSRPVQVGPQSIEVNNGRVNTPVLSASATSPAASDLMGPTSPVISDPMGPTLHDEKLINQGILSCFNGKVPPNYKFNTGAIDKMTCHLWERAMKTNPKMYERICVLTSQYSAFKLRVLARLTILPSWWWYREQIVTVLRNSGKWPVEDGWTDQQVKNAVDLQTLYEQTVDITEPF